MCYFLYVTLAYRRNNKLLCCLIFSFREDNINKNYMEIKIPKRQKQSKKSLNGDRLGGHVK